jgi:signal transduction histidine kinase
LRNRVSVMVLILLSALPSTTQADFAAIDSLNNLGRDHLHTNVEQSIELYGQLAEETRALGYLEGEARALQNLALVLYMNGRYEASVQAYLQAIRIFEERHLTHELALAYGDLGYQMKRRNLPRATGFMRQGIAIAQEDQDPLTLATLYDNFGVLQEMADLPDSAGYYYQLALDLKVALNDSMGIPFSLNHLAGIAYQQENFESATDLMRLSDQYRQTLNDSYGLLLNSVHWGDLYFNQGDLVSAADYYQRTLQLPGAVEQGYLLSYCYKQLAIIFERDGDFEKALHNHQRFTAFQDSLSGVETTSRMAALEIEFETEKKDRLLAENKLAMEARSREIQILLIILVALAAGGAGIVRYQYLARHQLRREMKLKSQLRKTEHEQQMADEKLRISRELHDNIGAQITFLTSSIDNLSHQSTNGKVKQGLDTISKFGRNTLAELRQTVWAMKNEAEGLDALVSRYQELKRQCASTGRKLELDVKRETGVTVDLSSGRLLNLYRIAQEAVQNALKHTEDGTISLSLDASRNGLDLSIKDQGSGFNNGDQNHVGGLINMRQRCAESGGTFDLSSDTSGTRITCHFPIN